MDDWGLQAVVRGYCTTTASSFVHVDEPFFFFDPALLEEEAHVAVATPFANVLSSEPSAELDELWKPFCSSSSTSRSAAAILHQQRPISSPGAPSHSQPRSKRRKSQQKRVVCHVPAEGLSSDLWAWRKYGQKPIKGSPYPRGYYRCSSSKGCIARKQVERSRNDPAMFVLTYTGEHNHPVPTHRNSLAGSTRQKYSDQNIAGASSTTTTTPDSGVGGGGESRNGTWLHSADLSPTTPSAAVMEESSKMSLYEEDAEPGMEAEWMGETEEYSDMFLDLDELYNDVFTDRLDDCFSMGFPAWDCGMGTGAACCDSLQRGQNRITEEQNRGEERK